MWRNARCTSLTDDRSDRLAQTTADRLKLSRVCRLASPNYKQSDQRRRCANNRAEREGEPRAHPMRDRSGLEASQWNHRAEDKRPHTHHAPTHLIGHDCLEHGVGCGEKQEHSKSGNEKEPECDIKVSAQRKGE